MTSMNAAIRFAATATVRAAAHQLADFWIQRPHHALDKGKPGAAGAIPCSWHVLSYSLTSAAAVLAANKLLGLGLSVRGQLLGELISAVTHYAAGRREHGLLYPLADALGKGDYMRNGGLLDLDQSWHHVANTVASAVTALDQGRR